MRSPVVVVVLLAACKFSPTVANGDDGTTPGVDAGVIDTPEVNPPPDGTPTCLDAWKAHTIRIDAPAKITELSTTVDERDPFLTPDELTIYFSIDNGTPGVDVDMDIEVATRPSLADPFGTPTFIGQIDDVFDQGKIALTTDGLFAIYASDATGGQGATDLWGATRGAPTDAIDTSSEGAAAGVDTNKDQTDPWLSPHGERLYYADVASNHQVIEVAARDGTGVYTSPTTLIDSGKGDADPTLSADELVIVFSSNRTGSGDLYYATRASLAEPFGTPIAVPSVNTAASDGDPHLSADGCHLYFASKADSGSVPDYNLWVAAAHP